LPVAPYYQNDDGVINPITLPFTFCFYGQAINTVYINNNGNVSFGQQYGSYVPATFPMTNYSMVAPFWADVDTRDPAALPEDVCWYKITPTYMIVQWDTVGYFGMHYDKQNTFQVIMSNGSDPIIPYGNNVQFCYKTMEWTTGDASGGTNGFQGSPATVGANKGDGVNFIQIGLFDQPGSSYSGQFPTAPYDGISWLDNQSFFLNTCSSGNLPPIAAGVSPCDTFIICTGDTVLTHISFLSIKSTEIINAGILPPIPPGVTIVANHSGNTDTMEVQLIGNPSLLGYHTITLYGYNNEVPPDTTYVSFVLEVDSNATGIITASVDSVCPGDSSELSIANANTTHFLWNTGQTTQSIWVKPTKDSTYKCTLSHGKCNDLVLEKTIYMKHVVAKISGPDTVCPGTTITITASGGGNYLWSTGASGSSINVAPTTKTTYSVVVNKNGCIDTASDTMAVYPVITLSACCDTTINQGDTIQLRASGSNNYLWTPSIGLACDSCQNPYASPYINTTYTVSTQTQNGCSSDVTVTIDVIRECAIYIPDAFTPNKDEKNDFFAPKGVCIGSYTMDIFNRWGTKIYTTNNSAPWDGKINGTPAQEDVYVYQLHIIDVFQQSHNYVGKVTLLK
jgi:gliding motility-associated-like protein